MLQQQLRELRAYANGTTSFHLPGHLTYNNPKISLCTRERMILDEIFAWELTELNGKYPTEVTNANPGLKVTTTLPMRAFRHR